MCKAAAFAVHSLTPEDNVIREVFCAYVTAQTKRCVMYSRNFLRALEPRPVSRRSSRRDGGVFGAGSTDRKGAQSRGWVLSVCACAAPCPSPGTPHVRRASRPALRIRATARARRVRGGQVRRTTDSSINE
ncbi:hypothetical protein EVAR_40719_1 [Eumeta japonica]|uniref:Uncharacterized protein n=1 Tax=Eumeta variegata TaxID=151549 RepID=A0A4C1X842_EUMVA|nr:hypothetical protein EVAR_40719_1 [Eumeta japonica]